MIVRCLILLALSLPFSLQAQQLPQGFWNAGRSFALHSPDQEKLIIENHLTEVQLYPGFAVVKNMYEIYPKERDSVIATFHWTDTATTPHPFFGSLHNLPSAGMTVLLGSDTLAWTGSPFTITFQPFKITKITTYQLCPTSQAKLSRNEGLREHNGLIISNGHWKNYNNRKVWIELKGGLTQLDLTGVYPVTVTGNRTRLRWFNDQSDSSIIIWYQGAAPDYKFEKKVVPQKRLLFEDINTFNANAFAEETFSALTITDFSTNAKQTWTSSLYFILFSIPWILLVVFIIYLLKKPKK